MAIHTHHDVATPPIADWYDSIGNLYTATATTVVLAYQNNETRLFGNFTVNAEGKVTGGVVTSMQRVAPGGSTVYESVTDLSMNATLFLSKAGSHDKWAMVLGGSDTIVGSSGYDHMRGLAGPDSMAGGMGDDQYDVFDAGDTVFEGADAGSDLIHTTLNTYVLGDNFENLWFEGPGNFSGTGNGLDNYIMGKDGNDILSGGGGNDYLLGQGGADDMTGGSGNDTYYIDDAGDAVHENFLFGGTYDQVWSSLATYTLAEFVEGLSISISTGATVSGNFLNNQLFDGAGDDTMFGLGGNDNFYGFNGGNNAFYGGLGDDVYVFNGATTQVIELAGEGKDEVNTDVANYTLGANLENLAYTGMANFTGTGNTLDNRITGYNGNDVLFGGTAGNDLLDGGKGDDTLRAWSGNDDLMGGMGSDTVSFLDWNSGVTLNLENSFTQIGAGSVYLYDIENITGGNGGDTLRGSLGDNVLDGAGGADTLQAWSGIDTFLGGAGLDTVTFAGWSSGVTIDLDLTAAQAVAGGSVKLAAIENVVGGNGADTLKGSTGANVLNGGMGNDTLRAWSGIDTFIGGDGADTLSFLGWSSGVSISLASSAAQAVSGGSVTQLAMENLTGGNGADTLSGSSVGNVLTGGLGKDTLSGGMGDDTFRFVSVSDSMVANRDVIADFDDLDMGGDRIDLAPIDAISGGMDNGFSFLAGANSAFNAAGQLRWYASGGNTFIEGNVDADLAADFAIQLAGIKSLVVGDFIL